MEIKNGLIVGTSEDDGEVFGPSLLVGQNEIQSEGIFADESIWEADIETEPRDFDDAETDAIIRGLCSYLDGSFDLVLARAPSLGVRKQIKLQELSVKRVDAAQYLRDIALKLRAESSA